MIQIAREYLEALEIVNTQYTIVKHTDRAHLHLHILANMVDNDGKPIKDSWIGLRGKKVAQQLTRKYQLIPAEGKHLDLTHLEAFSQSEANRYKIYQAIVDSLPQCRSLPDLEKRLIAKGIHTQYKYKGQTQELQGISFRIGKDRFKGSQIDRKFSLAGLQKSLAAQRQSKEIKPALPLEARRKAIPIRGISQKPTAPSPLFSQALPPLLLQLLAHTHTDGGVPYDQNIARKKKKKRKGLGL